MGGEKSGSRGQRLQPRAVARAALLTGACFAFALATGCFQESIGAIPSDPEELREELFKAVKYHGPRRVKALIEAGAQADARDLLGWTPLLFAVNRLHQENDRETRSIEALVEGGGVDVNVIGNDGSTPIMLAVRYGAIEVLDLLLEHGADFDSRDDIGMTLLMKSARYQQPEMIEHLLDRGADIDEQLPGGGTALFLAVRANNSAIVRLLIERGAGVRGNEKAASPIIFAAALHDEQVVELLLEAGADVNSVNQRNGLTPLHRAVASGPSMVELLLKAGARRDVSDKNGSTPLDHAKELGDFEMIRLLGASS